MRVLGLQGSSRKHGNTDLLLDKVLQGVTATKVFLYEKRIQPIDDRRHDPDGFGVVTDDYDELIQQSMAHDAIVFATPVYWYGMSGQMKDFVDRWSQTLRDKRYDFKTNMAGKKAYVIIVGGDAPKIKGLPLIQQFEYIFDFMNMDFRGYLIGEGNKPGDVLSDTRVLADVEWMNRELKGQ